MHALGSRSSSSDPASSEHVPPCLMHRQQVRHQKERAISSFVSPVPLVPPYLELIDDNRMGDWERQGKALVGPPPSALGQVGPVQQPRSFKVGLQGRDTGETGGTPLLWRHDASRKPNLWRS